MSKLFPENRSLLDQHSILLAVQFVGREHSGEVSNGSLEERNGVWRFANCEVNVCREVDGLVEKSLSRLST